LLCDKANSPSSLDSQVHANVPAGTRHYYAVFTYDKVPNYSLPVHADTMVPKPGDLDEDGDVDQDDFGLLQGCLTGQGIRQTAASCWFADFDMDSDVDQHDWGAFSRCMSGADVPSDPNCRQ